MTKDMALPAGRAVVNGAASGSAVPASAPSAWRTDSPPFGQSPIWQFVYIQGEQYHSGDTWFRQGWGLATIRVAHAEDHYQGYRKSDIEAICRNHGIDFNLGPVVVGWLPACAPAPMADRALPPLAQRDEGEWSATPTEPTPQPSS